MVVLYEFRVAVGGRRLTAVGVGEAVVHVQITRLERQNLFCTMLQTWRASGAADFRRAPAASVLLPTAAACPFRPMNGKRGLAMPVLEVALDVQKKVYFERPHEAIVIGRL